MSGDQEIPGAAPVPVTEATETATTEGPGQAEGGAATTSTTPPVVNDSLKNAFNSLVQGKRHLLVKDVSLAISALGEACRLFADLKGSFCSESGEAHFYYGKALLEQARLELGVFEGGPEAEGEEEDDDDEEGEDGDEGAEGEGGDEEEEKEEAAAETPEAEAKSPAVVDLNAPSPVEPIKKSTEETNGTSASSTSANGNIADDEKPSTSKGPAPAAEEAEADTEGEPTNLELAWEALEVSKVAYIKQIEEVTTNLAKTRSNTSLDDSTKKAEVDDLLSILKTLRRKLADTHVLLGEVATESEQYLAAEEDFRTALTILGDIEEPDSRQSAQCYFQLGITYAFDKKFIESIECFQKSAALIRLRITNLQKLVGPGPEVTDEIKELEALLPELDEKITDTRDAQRESLKTIEEEQEEQEIIMRNSPIKNPNPPQANDISHLVKKKKKIDEVEVENGVEIEPPGKKQCVGNGIGSGAEVEPVSVAANGNGIAAAPEDAVAPMEQ